VIQDTQREAKDLEEAYLSTTNNRAMAAADCKCCDGGRQLTCRVKLRHADGIAGEIYFRVSAA
jgi:hypothetical protein